MRPKLFAVKQFMELAEEYGYEVPQGRAVKFDDIYARNINRGYVEHFLKDKPKHKISSWVIYAKDGTSVRIEGCHINSEWGLEDTFAKHLIHVFPSEHYYIEPAWGYAGAYCDFAFGNRLAVRSRYSGYEWLMYKGDKDFYISAHDKINIIVYRRHPQNPAVYQRIGTAVFAPLKYMGIPELAYEIVENTQIEPYSHEVKLIIADFRNGIGMMSFPTYFLIDDLHAIQETWNNYKAAVMLLGMTPDPNNFILGHNFVAHKKLIGRYTVQIPVAKTIAPVNADKFILAVVALPQWYFFKDFRDKGTHPEFLQDIAKTSKHFYRDAYVILAAHGEKVDEHSAVITPIIHKYKLRTNVAEPSDWRELIGQPFKKFAKMLKYCGYIRLSDDKDSRFVVPTFRHIWFSQNLWDISYVDG